MTSSLLPQLNQPMLKEFLVKWVLPLGACLVLTAMPIGCGD